MKIIYLIRHGQSEHNIAPVYQSKDSALSKLGIQQAKKVAKRFADVTDLEVIISSPYQRANHTARAISGESPGAPLFFDPLFVERIKPSSIEGKPFTDLPAKNIWLKWQDSLLNTPNLKALDGENYSEIVKRADAALAYLLARKEDNIAVVSHGKFIQTIIARILAGDMLTQPVYKNILAGTHIDNTSVTILTQKEIWDKKIVWNLHTLNDTSHLFPQNE